MKIIDPSLHDLYNQRLADIEKSVKSLNEPELPVDHNFSPGLYVRSIFMPAGTFVIGRTHKTEHFNFVQSGSATVWSEGERKEIKAPCMFKSSAGVKKVLLIHEDMLWTTTHPTDETDLGKLENICVLSEEEELEKLEEERKSVENKIKQLETEGTE